MHTHKMFWNVAFLFWRDRIKCFESQVLSISLQKYNLICSSRSLFSELWANNCYSEDPSVSSSSSFYCSSSESVSWILSKVSFSHRWWILKIIIVVFTAFPFRWHSPFKLVLQFLSTLYKDFETMAVKRFRLPELKRFQVTLATSENRWRWTLDV